MALTKAATTYVNAYTTFVNTEGYSRELEAAVHSSLEALEFAAEAYAEAVREERIESMFW